MSAIIIIGRPDQVEVRMIAKGLQRYAFEIGYIDFTQFPRDASVSWRPNNERGMLNLHNQSIPFETVAAVFWHRATAPAAVLRRDVHSAMSPFLHYSGTNWVNGIQAMQYHQHKPRQLLHAKQLGAIIPKTYIGNDYREALSFLSEFSDCIVKPVQGGQLTECVDEDFRQEQRLARRLQQAPITLQTRINGSHIRSFVIGPHVYSAEIESDALDYRLDAGANLALHELPRAQTELARRICRGFGMKWCAIDWRLYKNEYVFLEANPSPFFSRFEHDTQYPITQGLVKLLVTPFMMR